MAQLGEERQMYQMADLGYARTPTSAVYGVTMGDGSRWDVPVQLIADSRDAHYQDDKEDTVGYIRAGTLGKFEIADWAVNNMNWSDVKEYATKAEAAPQAIDWEDGWANGKNGIVGEI